MNSHLFTNRSRQISFGLLLFVGTMMMAGASRAGGGSGVGLKVTIEDAVQTQAIWVGPGILVAVYADHFSGFIEPLLPLLVVSWRFLPQLLRR